MAAVLFPRLLSRVLLGTATDGSSLVPTTGRCRASTSSVWLIFTATCEIGSNASFRISRRRKPKHRGKRAVCPRSQRQSGEGTRARCPGGLCTALSALLPSDAAFLAREKAKADAECYTAMKLAEANKVKPGAPWGREGGRIWVWAKAPGVGWPAPPPEPLLAGRDGRCAVGDRGCPFPEPSPSRSLIVV